MYFKTVDKEAVTVLLGIIIVSVPQMGHVHLISRRYNSFSDKERISYGIVGDCNIY